MRSARKSLTWRQLNSRINDKAVYIELWRSKLNTSSIILTPIEAMAKTYDKNFNDKKKDIDIDNFNHAYEDNPRYRSSEVYIKILKQIDAIKNKTESILQILLSSSSPAPVPAGSVLTLTSETAALLRAIERHASFDDIMYFRSLAENEVTVSSRDSSWAQGVLLWAIGAFITYALEAGFMCFI
jgi:hypothetical protein